MQAAGAPEAGEPTLHEVCERWGSALQDLAMGAQEKGWTLVGSAVPVQFVRVSQECRQSVQCPCDGCVLCLCDGGVQCPCNRGMQYPCQWLHAVSVQWMHRRQAVCWCGLWCPCTWYMSDRNVSRACSARAMSKWEMRNICCCVQHTCDGCMKCACDGHP